MEPLIMPEAAPEYAAARRVLLDALCILEPHLANLVLVGAQAVYLHTGDRGLAVPIMTTDADLALDTAQLSDHPEIAAALVEGGFAPGANPGHWIGRGDVAVDIMVVPHQAGTTSKTARSARIPPHSKKVGRIARGLEPALIDHTPMVIRAFGPSDPRAFTLNVAGPGALLVAKAIKIAERAEDARKQSNRLRQKDALDMFRLLQGIPTEQLVAGLHSHRARNDAAAVSREGVEFVAAHGTWEEGMLPSLATEAAFGDLSVAPAFAALARQLIAALDRDSQ
ncbi:MAG: hypothetical protein LBH48_03830 [Bifidobacteriaceae bacterium]|jgi:hypothetical protein|nr:hypothetical protein [Bifidobacteriaceae bacterium]